MLYDVFPFFQINQIWGYSDQAKYLFGYLNDLSARTCIIEEEYVDKDYLVDYSNFYARSFENKKRFTKRIHFFSRYFSKDNFIDILVNRDQELLKRLKISYLGFTIIKPIEDIRYNPLIGRTILRTYPQNINDEHRFYVNGLHKVSLFGISLKIKSLPFQTQDTAVGACATAACWIASHPLNDLFGTQKLSPFEITKLSVNFPSLERNFPSTGLNPYQIKSYFNSIGLETEFIDIEKTRKIEGYTSTDDIIADTVRAYTKLGLPIIAGLELKKDGDADYHAVVISGYRHKYDIVKELYVHDDQIGPYSKACPDGNFIKWKNEWIMIYGYSDLTVKTLIVPIYQKIRLSFGHIYPVFLNHKRRIEELIRLGTVDERLTPVLYLMDVVEYKKFIWEHSCENKEELLCKSFPRFLWIIRYSFRRLPVIDYVYDGTSVFAKEFCCITFTYS